MKFVCCICKLYNKLTIIIVGSLKNLFLYVSSFIIIIFKFIMKPKKFNLIDEQDILFYQLVKNKSLKLNSG